MPLSAQHVYVTVVGQSATLLNIQTPPQTVVYTAMTRAMVWPARTDRFMIPARSFARSSPGNGRTASSIAAERPNIDITGS
jgi:hypothetical protein